MGTCNDQMKPSKSAKDDKKDGGWFRKKQATTASLNFVDHVDICEASIAELVGHKKKDLDTEGASMKKENALKLKMLQAMQHHVTSARQLAELYAEG